MLLSREVRVADREGASGRWSLDHLFVDQDAIPTLVEVKRSSDTRIRREVVGQLLEYAANGSRHWPVEQLRALFEAACQSRGDDPDSALRGVLGEEADIEAWWAQVGTNLRLGRLRLVFVADVISRELRRIIEFLNEQMTQTEVIGVEIRQYVDASGEHQTIVPRLIGQTEAARDIKTRSSSSPIRRYDAAMANLIDAGLIPPEGVLTSHLSGGGHEARYTREIVEHQGTIYNSPSMAARAAIGHNVNGWDFWHVPFEGNAVKLAVVRDRYLAERDAR